jgi:hypothetical protein
MKRYFAFYGDIYYPNGGMIDFIGDYESLEDCKKKIEEKNLQAILDDPNWDWSWFQIWDSHTRTFIENTL